MRDERSENEVIRRHEFERDIDMALIEKKKAEIIQLQEDLESLNQQYLSKVDLQNSIAQEAQLKVEIEQGKIEEQFK
jgi:hypothetical protein